MHMQVYIYMYIYIKFIGIRDGEGETNCRGYTCWILPGELNLWRSLSVSLNIFDEPK